MWWLIMSEKIYVISCTPDLESFGMDRMRSSVEGLEEAKLSLDWSKIRLVPVIAAEKANFQIGESHIVHIKPIPVPAYSIVIKSLYGVNGMGHLACIGCTDMKKYSEDKTANMSIFNSRIKASVLPGDLLGQVLVIPGKKA
jgi:hypothetical protein